MHNTPASRGFALPTVIIASVVLFAVLAAAISTVASTATSLSTQYYDSLAADAAESGAAYANSCLQNNEFVSSWGTKSLTPKTDCVGTTVSAQSAYIISNSTYRTSFTVGSTNTTGNGIQVIQVTGTVELLRSNGLAWKTYQKSTNVRVGAQVSTRNVYFSYADDNVSFFTLGGDGILRGTGANTLGQLGNGTLTNTLVSTPVSLPYGVSVNTTLTNPVNTNFLNVGKAASVIGSDGQAYFSGPNTYGQMGYGSTDSTPPGVFKQFALPAGKTAKFATPQADNNYVITNDGYIYAAGRCTYGGLGNGTSGSCADASSPVLMSGLPTPNAATPSTIPVNIVGDGVPHHILMQDGSVYGFGKNGMSPGGVGIGGALGVNVALGNVVPTPTKVVVDGVPTSFGTGSKVCTYGDTSTSLCAVDVQETGYSSYILTNTGAVYASGDNRFGMLGMPSSVSTTTVFKKVTLPAGDTIATSISADAFELVMLTTNGNVYTAGVNRNSSSQGSGVAGCGTPVDGSSTCPFNSLTQVTYNGTPVNMMKFKLPSGVKGTYIWNTSHSTSGVTAFSTFVIGSDNKVYAAGDNTWGELGDGCTLSTPIGPNSTCTTSLDGQPASVVGNPVVMKIFDGSKPSLVPVVIQSGNGTTIIRTANGVVYAVGRNHNGQLGDGTTRNSSVPHANPYLNQVSPTTF